MAGRCEHYGQRKLEESEPCERVPAIHTPDVSPGTALDELAYLANIGSMDGRSASAEAPADLVAVRSAEALA
jgi:hypothetical protein